jgi:uncharacterized protein YqiB (DUF1249 family)
MKKYVPDLTKQMALCEANYARLIKLLPDVDDCDQRNFIVDMAQQQSTVSICVLERFKFTTSVAISQSSVLTKLDPEIQRMMSPTVQVRLYHDAKMAEVTGSNNHQQLKGKYDYPNESMYQVDEKLQLNEYLGQWLSHCLTHGYQSQEIMRTSLSEYE